MLKCAMVCWMPARALADLHRVADRLDADAVDREAAGVGLPCTSGIGRRLVALVHEGIIAP
jgi:hypothetical protein